MSGGIYINGIQKGLVAPLADAAGNETVAEVVGNKTDTVAGDSLVALSKQILAAAPTAADVTAIKAVTDLIPDAGAMTSIAQEATLGTPAGASIAADIAALNDLSAADVNAEVDTALDTIIPAAPTAGSLNDILSKASGGNTFDKATDSLEALRDIIDTYNTADQADLDAILEDTGTTLPSTLSGLDTKIDTIDTVVDGIQTDLDNATDGLGALKLLIDAVQSDLDNATDGLGALKLLIDAVQSTANAIETDTQDLQTQIGVAGAGLSAIPDMALDSTVAKSADLATTDGKVDTLQTTADNIETDTQDIQTQIGTAGAGLTAIPNVAQAAANTSGDSSGTLSYLDAGGEQTVVELTTTTRKVLYGISLDMTNIAEDGAAIKVYLKPDGTNYKEILAKALQFSPSTDGDGLYIDLNMSITSDFKLTFTEGADEAAAKDIHYSLVYRTIE
jgi:hypothetical protein